MPFTLFKKTKSSQNGRSPRKKIPASPAASPSKTIPDFFKTTTKSIKPMPLSRKTSVRKDSICIDYGNSVGSDDSTLDATPLKSVNSSPTKKVNVTPPKSLNITSPKCVKSTPLKNVKSTPTKSVNVTPPKSLNTTPPKSVKATPLKSVNTLPKSVKRPLFESNGSSVKKIKLDSNVLIVYKNLEKLTRIYEKGLWMHDSVKKEKYLKESIADIFKQSKNDEISKENTNSEVQTVGKNFENEPQIPNVQNLDLSISIVRQKDVEHTEISKNVQNLSITPVKTKKNIICIDLTDSAIQNDPSVSKELPNDVINSIINGKEIPITPKKPTTPKKYDSLYSDVLLYCINKSKIYSPSIFDENTNKICITYKNLRSDEKILYQNLLCRKWDWIRRDSLTYSYISDIPGALESLMIKGFIQPIDSTCNFDDILWSMNVSELSDLCLSFKTGKKGKKEELIESLKNVANRQGYQFTTNSQSVKEKMISKAIEGKKSIKLTESRRDLFLKMLISCTCPFYKGEENIRLSSLRIKLKELENKEKKLYPLNIYADKLFLNINTFEKYYKSIVLKSSLQDAKLKKNWPLVSDICQNIKNEFDTFMQSDYNVTLLNDHSEFFHRKKFMAGSNLAYCLSSSIDVLKREKRYNFALECLDVLLNQNHFVKRRRAKWYEDKILIYERYRKQSPEVIYELLIKALNDDNLTLLGKRIISKKAEPYVQPKARKISNDKKENLQKLMIYRKSFIETTEYSCKSMPNVTTSKKQIFVQDTDDGQVFSTVEDLSIGYYKDEYPTCFHDEGSLLKKLTLALFFPIIYEDIPGMFVSELQELPLDWGGERFFNTRKDKFESYKEILMQGDEAKVEEELYSNQLKLDNTVQNKIIDLKRHDIPNLINLLKCMTLEKFMKFAFYLLENFSERKSGLPDLTMFNIHDKKCAFIEVKGPSDTPSQNQILWMEKLQEFGLNTRIFKVSCAIPPKQKLVPMIEETQTNM